MRQTLTSVCAVVHTASDRCTRWHRQCFRASAIRTRIIQSAEELFGANVVVADWLMYVFHKQGLKIASLRDALDLQLKRIARMQAEVAGDHGAHGTFDSRATAQREALWAATYMKVIGFALLGVVGLAYAALSKGTGETGRTQPRMAA